LIPCEWGSTFLAIVTSSLVSNLFLTVFSTCAVFHARVYVFVCTCTRFPDNRNKACSIDRN
jgi:hypothetical protein